ncbi:C2 domain-containing protein At1g53590-like isoform X2 [Punica granatum]|uniref:C2 domain-containing protein At1g53590-like isoform X2 n=1 Tax=Punica granatum TaxID=22663 RepID=A0A6P8CPM3_PUNGR|nr:C2 domain-containing protein At1g53590-like isoform X2 [Punica granatum]
MDITEVTIIHHAGIVLLGLWLLAEFNWCHPVAYFISLVYLYLVHERYVLRLQKKLQFEERKQSYQRRVLTDSETVRWLNHAVEKIWPVCMEQIASQKILLPIIPWFLEKYKPWTAKEAVVQHLYMGRNPPIFTEMRVLRQGSEDDHLVLELGMNFLTAEDMSAILAVKLRKRLGFGMWAKLHITGMHVEGKVLIGVKFLEHWPFLGRLRVCFAEPPYFQMTVKPIFTHGIDVTELPGIAGWLDKLLSVAFEQTLVQDVEDYYYIPSPVGHIKCLFLSSNTGLSDPYVKGQLGPYRFKTKIQKKTLSPKWLEEFRIPIITWETPNILSLEVCDKDHFIDDALGNCSINVNDLRDGQRHDIWVALQDVKVGRLHLAITVLEENAKGDGSVQGDADSSAGESLFQEEKASSFAKEQPNRGSFSSRSLEKSPRMADKYEPIDIEGQKETGIWIQQPGSEVSQTWEPRKGKSRRLDTEIIRAENDPLASDPKKTPGGTAYENQEEKHLGNPMKWGFRKIGSVFHRNQKKDDQASIDGDAVPSPYVNVREIGSTKIGVNLIVEKDQNLSPDGSGSESPSKGNLKDKAKGFLKQAEKSARSLKQVLSKKGSRRLRGEIPLENIPSDSDSSDDESLPPSVYTHRADSIIPIASEPISSGEGSHSPKSTEKGGRASTDSSDVPIESENVVKEKAGSVDDISGPKLPIADVVEEKSVDLDGQKS